MWIFSHITTEKMQCKHSTKISTYRERNREEENKMLFVFYLSVNLDIFLKFLFEYVILYL